MLRYSPGFVVALVLVAGCAPSGMADLADELGCKKIKDHPKGLYVPPGATLVADCYLGGKDVATITWFDNDNNKARDRYVEDVDGLTTDGFVVGDHWSAECSTQGVCDQVLAEAGGEKWSDK